MTRAKGSVAGAGSAEPQYRIDPLTLREVPADRAAAEAWLAGPEAASGPAAARIAWLRILGRLAEAEAEARESFAAAAAGDTLRDLPLAAVLPGIRLAQVLQWQGDLVQALRLLARVGEALSRSAESAAVLSAAAFLHQHRGKVLLDAGHPGWALREFRQAERLRDKPELPADQLESTRQAVSAALRTLDKQQA
ncbi:hypothetical protein [Arthrobacter sp. zg-Y1143]|uniref:hypothetical protein n=1 Tax=Arthrobacter sp. zg-Y1143 TaxID=3049065 RepID=UPI0024C35DA5|nr:hypothetical protein [Arthrobacter sp. zg-Y1143]MDK1327479.1 hypothetical protein [Arthrobacter sp. zg-Y1143]